jgi:C4-dicarboxylate transporter, DctQ subunit
MSRALRIAGRSLDVFEDVTVVVLFLAAVLLYFSQVVSRYAFGFTFAWAEEVIVTMVVWACFIGASIATRHHAHISVDLVVNQLPRVPRRIAALAALGLWILFAFLMFWWGAGFVVSVAATGNRAESIDVPAYVLYIAVPLGGALMTIRLLQEVWKVLRPGWTPALHHHAAEPEEGGV